jgi:hypothetical protein
MTAGAIGISGKSAESMRSGGDPRRAEVTMRAGVMQASFTSTSIRFAQRMISSANSLPPLSSTISSHTKATWNYFGIRATGRRSVSHATTGRLRKKADGVRRYLGFIPKKGEINVLQR